MSFTLRLASQMSYLKKHVEEWSISGWGQDMHQNRCDTYAKFCKAAEKWMPKNDSQEHKLTLGAFPTHHSLRTYIPLMWTSTVYPINYWLETRPETQKLASKSCQKGSSMLNLPILNTSNSVNRQQARQLCSHAATLKELSLLQGKCPTNIQFSVDQHKGETDHNPSNLS